MDIDLDRLRSRKLFIATPMAGGKCEGLFDRSMVELVHLLAINHLQYQYGQLFSESLITRGRTYLANAFIRSDCTDLLFIDADTGFRTMGVITLLALMAHPENPYDILAVPCPKKNINWENIVKAVKLGLAEPEKGGPTNLVNFLGKFVYNASDKEKPEYQKEIIDRVSTAGTGFMLISRKAFERFNKHYPDRSFIADEDVLGPNHPDLMYYFHSDIDPQTRRLLSEDWYFCRMIEKAGGLIGVVPHISLYHVGSYAFGGALVDLAQLNPTSA